MSTQINITDYETLLSAAKQQTEPQRLLFVFLRASLPDQHNDEEVGRFHAGKGGALRPIMVVDKTLDELGSFSDLAAESEKMGQDWQIVLIAALSGKNGIAPNSSEAELPLKMMIQTVENGGDLSRYLAFDRNGVLVHFS
jgi:hypothetical protein